MTPAILRAWHAELVRPPFLTRARRWVIYAARAVVAVPLIAVAAVLMGARLIVGLALIGVVAAAAAVSPWRWPDEAAEYLEKEARK